MASMVNGRVTPDETRLLPSADSGRVVVCLSVTSESMCTIGVAPINQVTHMCDKIVTFKGGHLMW